MYIVAWEFTLLTLWIFCVDSPARRFSSDSPQLSTSRSDTVGVVPQKAEVSGHKLSRWKSIIAPRVASLLVARSCPDSAVLFDLTYWP